MVLVIIRNQVNNQEAYLALARQFVADSRCDPGCLGMEIAVQPEDKHHVTFISRWEEKSDFEAHCEGSSFAKHIPVMAPYYEGGVDSIYELVR